MRRYISHKVVQTIYEDALGRYICLCCGETYDQNIFNEAQPCV